MFDLIIGNPPYVMLRITDENYKRLILSQWPEIKHTSINLSSIFVLLSARLCNPNGMMCFVINRAILHNYYDGLILRQSYSETGLYPEERVSIDKGIFGRYSPQASIITWTKQNKPYEVSVHIQSPKKRLKDRGIWVCSSACTGKNKVYIIKTNNVNDNYAQIIKNKRSFLIEKSILKHAVHTTRIKNGQIPENNYIIFPYTDDIVAYDSDYMYTNFPMAMEYLEAHRPLLDVPEKEIWYVYTRRPSACVLKPKIIVAHITKDFNIFKIAKPYYVHYSGYAITYKGDINKLYSSIDIAKYKHYISKYAQHMGEGWFSVRGHMIEKALLESIDFSQL